MHNVWPMRCNRMAMTLLQAWHPTSATVSSSAGEWWRGRAALAPSSSFTNRRRIKPLGIMEQAAELLHDHGADIRSVPEFWA